MINLLGEIWRAGPPNWAQLLSDPNVKLHLYDKGEARPGRKMGHFCVTGQEIEATLRSAPSTLHSTNASIKHFDPDAIA